MSAGYNICTVGRHWNTHPANTYTAVQISQTAWHRRGPMDLRHVLRRGGGIVSSVAKRAGRGRAGPPLRDSRVSGIFSRPLFFVLKLFAYPTRPGCGCVTSRAKCTAEQQQTHARFDFCTEHAHELQRLCKLCQVFQPIFFHAHEWKATMHAAVMHFMHEAVLSEEKYICSIVSYHTYDSYGTHDLEVLCTKYFEVIFIS